MGIHSADRAKDDVHIPFESALGKGDAKEIAMKTI